MSKKEKREKKRLMSRWMPYIVGAIIGISIVIIEETVGVDLTRIWDAIEIDYFSADLWNFIGTLVIFVLASYIHIIIHEGGHLVAGLMSGYKFASFRIGRWMLIKKNHTYSIKQYTLPGTGGQCLLIPPEVEPCEVPYIWYNAAGAVFNMIFSAASIPLILFVDLGAWRVPVIMFCLSGVLLGVTNGIPLKIGGVANDGYNMKVMRQSKESRRALWIQLYVNAQIIQGIQLKDMPKHYFEVSEDMDMNNPLMAGIANYRYTYLQSIGDYEGAKVYIKQVLDQTEKLLPLYRLEFTCELLFHEIVTECRQEQIDTMYTKELKEYIRASRTQPSKQRLLYAYEKIVCRNNKAADKYLRQFNKTLQTTPFEGEIEMEQQMLQRVFEKYAV